LTISPLTYFSFVGFSTWFVAFTIAMSSSCDKDRIARKEQFVYMTHATTRGPGKEL
jgi:hypothetical protein